MHDTFVQGEEYVEPFLLDGFVHELFLLSDWHSHYVSQSDHWETPKRRYEQLKHYIFETRNGIKRYIEDVDIRAKDKNLFVYNSSITKGMVPLVEDLWPEVRKNIPDAKLMIIGGFYSNAGRNGGPDESEINFHKLMNHYNGKDGITFTGVIPQSEIAQILAKASFMLYPPAFPETYGISTLEAINYNTLPITSRYGALEEVAAKSVSYLTEYEYFKDNRQKQRMIESILRAYKDDYLREQKQYACDEIKPWSTWDKVAEQWKHHFYNVFRIIPSRGETESVRKITSNVNRIFRRRNINQEDLYEPFNCTSEKEIVVITPVYNAERYIGNCIYSVASQIYDNYTQIIIDDISTDETVERAKDVISALEPRLQSKFKIIKNTEKGNALSNQVKEIERITNDDAIIVLLDGDDWLYNNPDIFRFLNDLYETGTKITYGSCRSLADNINLIAQDYPKHIKETKAYRDYQFRWGIPYTHLRTFKKDLYNKIDKSLLLDSNGRFYGPGGDGALLYCLLEAANPNEIEAVKRILVEYNDLNPLNDYKKNSEEQDKNQAEILNKRKEKPINNITEIIPEVLKHPKKKIDEIFRLYIRLLCKEIQGL
jgi:glycosyltransferase involved in cell wall biosynthesis